MLGRGLINSGPKAGGSEGEARRKLHVGLGILLAAVAVAISKDEIERQYISEQFRRLMADHEPLRQCLGQQGDGELLATQD